MADDDDAERRREINLFAAMATGDYNSGTFDSETMNQATTDAASFSREATRSPSPQGQLANPIQQQSQEDSMQNLFSSQASSQLDNSGTFSRVPSATSAKPSARSAASEFNLEAAAASLADLESSPPHGHGSVPAAGLATISLAQRRVGTKGEGCPPQIAANSSPMHIQQVLLPRPLVFGPIVPPRVLNEARQIIREALDRQGVPVQNQESESLGPKEPPRTSQLRPGVRNLISCLQTYGHGINILSGDNGIEVCSKDDDACNGSPYVSIFCPAWGDDGSVATNSTAVEANQESDKESPSKSTKLEANDAPSSSAGASASNQDEPTTSTDDIVHSSSSAMSKPVLEQKPTLTVDTSHDKAISDRDLFSMWARGESDESGSGSQVGLSMSQNNKSSVDTAGTDGKKQNTENGDDTDSSNGSTNDARIAVAGKQPVPMSDQDLFSQWARGESPANESFRMGDSISKEGFFNSGTFQPRPSLPSTQDDSDDDSVVGSELKKKVGINESLNAAVASLEEEGFAAPGNDTTGTSPGVAAEDASEYFMSVPLTEDGGRPLSNLELMNGVTPLFGVDDAPLPVEADLGIHETKDEQQRSNEQRRNQALIENCCPQNVFGSVACPNPAVGPDDNHSWNSRSSPDGPTASLPPRPESPGPGKKGALSRKGKGDRLGKKGAKTRNSRFDARSRYGWWHVPDETELPPKPDSATESPETDSQSVEGGTETPLQLPPLEHSASALHIHTKLEPTPEKLQELNSPLSLLHPATSLSQSLPLLSDRPPSHRYVQVDTQAVGFPTLGGEVEPFFCSLAIYNVETISQGGNDQNESPVPNIQRCGRVTETLHFDIVSDPTVEKRCRGSLWPYLVHKKGDRGKSFLGSSVASSPSSVPEQERGQGSRCGVFPLPSNLNIANLYAVLIVHKVVSEGGDFEAYLRPGKETDRIDIEALRLRAEKAANQQGTFLMPFAFGVAPLVQVFREDTPLVAKSSAVRIPLFKFSSGLGDRQLIDHIMVMLYPRADHRGSGIAGRAPVTNGGMAMLVMRYFGYLGLHSVVHSKSSLARDRLIDFTGEVQMRRRETKDKPPAYSLPTKWTSLDKSGNVTVVPTWQLAFVTEPTVNGGRTIPSSSTNNSRECGDSDDRSTSHLSAQELAPLPLMLTPSSRPPMPSPAGLKAQRSGRGLLTFEDVEPFYHTSFCNELLCHTRLLHNCPKGNIVVKVEMREMEWRSEYNAYFAYKPKCGPRIHNPRRGPFLVQGAFTSCSSRCLDQHFLDEFKMKLPLELTSRSGEDSIRVSSLLFTVYRLSFSSRKKWARRLRPGKKSGKKIDEIAGDLAGEAEDEIESSKSCRLIQLSCGYLPLMSQASLISNGLHDVKMIYSARTPRRDRCETNKIEPETLIISELSETGKSVGTIDSSRVDTDDFIMDDRDTESVGSSLPFTDTASAKSASENDSAAESADDRRGRQLKLRQGSDPMALQVRIVVFSSLHAQNSTLGEFLYQDPDQPALLSSLPPKMSSLMRSSREELLQRLTSNALESERKSSYETDKLLISTVDISKPSLCSVADISGHLLRIVLQLGKVVVCGIGEPDLAWANPESIIPLRVHSFATLLQLLGSSTLYFAKRGLTQLDGSNKWNFLSLSRVIALLFDEGMLFGDQAKEFFSSDFLAGLKQDIEKKGAVVTNGSDSSLDGGLSPERLQRPPKEKRRRHVRSNFEINHMALEGVANSADFDFSKGTSATWSASTFESMKTSRDEKIFQSLAPAANLDQLVAFPRDAESNEALGTNGFSKSSTPESKNEKPGTKSAPSEIKLDTKFDFQRLVQAGSADGDGDFPTSKGANAALAMIHAFGSAPTGSRKWMTLPAPALATIREDSTGDGSEDEMGQVNTSSAKKGPLDSLDPELFLRPPGTAVKQMRVPKLSKKSTAPQNEIAATSEKKDDFGTSKEEPSFLELIGRSLQDDTFDSRGVDASPNQARNRTLPSSDAEIESAGEAFLDVIGKSLGISGLDANGTAGEIGRLGNISHKKTRSRCSIDWTIPDDLTSALANASPEEIQKTPDNARIEFDETMSSLQKEKDISLKLPTFVDRLLALGNGGIIKGRWFPFAYEIVIMQWVAILAEQRASAVDASIDDRNSSTALGTDGSLADAASRTGGVIVACAPVLFEIIKQSLGWRIACLFEAACDAGVSTDCPPLATLDDRLLQCLEQLITMITDACLDSRNFDSWDTRQTCIDVNDSIIRFLLDLFAFLDPVCVQRLIVTYMSRFVVKDGRQWQDRDSSIGLRCSWEITKLQMNAVTAFARFPNFIRVNAPQMANWRGSWTSAPAYSTTVFYDEILEHYHQLQMPSFVASEVGRHSSIIPRMRPHWLAEVVTDICLSGMEHVEHNIQQRSSSLLHELFWAQSQQSLKVGTTSLVASMYVTFLEKVLRRTGYLSTLLPKSQIRKDILPCVVFVLQSAPSGLLRALWRKLFARATGKGLYERFGGVGYHLYTESSDDFSFQEQQRRLSRGPSDLKSDPDIHDMFSLLNLALSTLEYEGNDDFVEVDNIGDYEGMRAVWRKEFLLALEYETADVIRRRRLFAAYDRSAEKRREQQDVEHTSSSSRKWHAHDGSLVLLNAAQQIVRELRFVLEPSAEGQSLLNPARRKARLSLKQQQRQPSPLSNTSHNEIRFSYDDTLIFVRAATSVYLHSLTLRQSDIALVKTLKASVEIIKIFGIKMFNEAVGETLQHWMRVVSLHCGSRRAEVRVPASDFLELILRSTWDSFGSFFRIRLPLLAVQTEVMERIVATAAARHYRDQRRMGTKIDLFSNGSAEASLAPLWRTLDRLHQQSASQNVAFRSALIRLAEKLKKLYRAYIAAHALSFLNRAKVPGSQSPSGELEGGDDEAVENELLMRVTRISVHRVINASAGFSKQFLGLYSTAHEHGKAGHRSTDSSTTGLEQSAVAHNEAVEDAFLDAADVFSPTELPDHRVAWLRKLAEFHSSRTKYAEEATCHFNIHMTLKNASRLHGSLWSSTPFLPWTDNMSDGIHLDGEGPAGDPDDYTSDFEELPDINYGRQMDKTNSFRRIFYRVANSIRGYGGDDLGSGTSKFLFYGVTLAAEYNTVSPWMTLREMEANMLEEAEAAGNLFLQAGIIESSRYAWSLATQYYAEKFIYGKLAHVYDRLARTVVSSVPPIDSSLQQEACVAVPLGRFYRVWFHGGAPDELIGAEFVYRTASSVKLEQFGTELREVIRCIIPEKTPIHLALDGRAEEVSQPSASNRLSGASLEPVRVKITPLRPIVRKASGIRGMPEWFDRYIESAFSGPGRLAIQTYGSGSLRRTNSAFSDGSQTESRLRRETSKSFSASVFSSGSHAIGGSAPPRRTGTSGKARNRLKAGNGELVGADKFSFLQPVNKDRSRSGRDWIKGSTGDFAEKTLRVTQLQVAHTFPACVARQAVVHRVVYTQSPLEAGVDSLCQWCAVLFRTAIATNGMALLGTNLDPGVGNDAAKVVADCIHSSRVKEMGQSLLQKNTNVSEVDDDVLHSYDRLSEEDVKKLQLKLARSLVVFMELLHLLIARNRDLLLDVIQERKKSEPGSGGGAYHTYNRSLTREFVSAPPNEPPQRPFARKHSIASYDSVSSQDGRSRGGRGGDESVRSQSQHQQSQHLRSGSGASGGDEYGNGSTSSSGHNEKVRTDSAIAVQSELQRAFISLAKALHPMILGIMGTSETPRWLKLCCQENYFSAYTYRQAKIPIGEELAFFPGDDIHLQPVVTTTTGGPGSHVETGSNNGGSGGIIPKLQQTSGGGMGIGGVGMMMDSNTISTPIPPPSSTAGAGARSMTGGSRSAPNSPGGSIGSSSAVSAGSHTGNKSVKSIKSIKSSSKTDDRFSSHSINL